MVTTETRYRVIFVGKISLADLVIINFLWYLRNMTPRIMGTICLFLETVRKGVEWLITEMVKVNLVWPSMKALSKKQ